jgi:cephalosporin hydroxylase
LKNEAAARSLLIEKVEQTESLSKEAMARIEKASSQNNTDIKQAQEQLEARLADRLKNAEGQLEATEGRLAEIADQKATSMQSQEQLEARLADRLRAAEEQLEAAEGRLAEIADQKATSMQSQEQLESRLAYRLKVAEEQLEATEERLKDTVKSQREATDERLEKEEEARSVLMTKVSAAVNLSEAAMESLQQGAERQNSNFTKAQTALENRLLERLNAMEGLLSKAEQSHDKTRVELKQAEQASIKEREELVAEITAAREQIANLETSIAETTKSVKDLDAGQAVTHQYFNRALSSQHIKAFKKDWLKPLNLKETDRSLAYMADRIGLIERNLKGRLATSIEDAVLRTLIAKSVTGQTLRVLEIGVLFGVSLAMIHDRTSDVFETVHVTALDPFEGYYGNNTADIVTQERVTKKTFVHNMETARVPEKNYTVIEGYSTDDKAIQAASKQLYDVLIIDGDHSYAGVKSDFVNFAPMVKRGGYILIDDDSAPEWPEITKYVDDELIPRPDITLIGRGWRTAVFKVIKKIKS